MQNQAFKTFIVVALFVFFAADSFTVELLASIFNLASGLDSVVGNSAYVFYLGIFGVIFCITFILSIINFSHKDWANMKFCLFVLLSQSLGLAFAAFF